MYVGYSRTSSTYKGLNELNKLSFAGLNDSAGSSLDFGEPCGHLHFLELLGEQRAVQVGADCRAVAAAAAKAGGDP